MKLKRKPFANCVCDIVGKLAKFRIKWMSAYQMQRTSFFGRKVPAEFIYEVKHIMPCGTGRSC